MSELDRLVAWFGCGMASALLVIFAVTSCTTGDWHDEVNQRLDALEATATEEVRP